MADLYYARRPFGYGDVMLDSGQVVELGGFRNDEKLVRLGYLEKVKGKPTILDCRLCPGKFLDDGARQRHGRRVHPDRPMDERARIEQAEREAKLAQRVAETGVQIENIAPLYLDQTAASKGVKPQRGRRA